MVRPSINGGIQRLSATMWLTSVRTSQSEHGVGMCHWSSATVSTLLPNSSHARRCRSGTFTNASSFEQPVYAGASSGLQRPLRDRQRILELEPSHLTGRRSEITAVDSVAPREPPAIDPGETGFVQPLQLSKER